jgi:hypothetical protein
MPAAAVVFLASSPALSAAFSTSANQGLAVDDNAVANTNAPTTNHAGKARDVGTNVIEDVAGQRG